MNEIKANPGRIVVLGRRKENQARCVTFDIVDWQREYGDGTVYLLAQRCQDEAPYPCAVTVENGIARWVINEADVAVPGQGKAELQYHVGDMVAVSETYRTWVQESLDEEGPEPPEPEQSWVDAVLKAASEVEEAAKGAVVESLTIGENGNWFIADEDTGVPATGPHGEPGAEGQKGESGVYCGETEPDSDYDVWIDPNGVPSGDNDSPGLPVVEISALVTADEAYLTDAEYAQVSKFIADGTPFVLKCRVELYEADIAKISGVATVVLAGTIEFAVLQFLDISVVIAGNTVSLRVS